MTGIRRVGSEGEDRCVPWGLWVDRPSIAGGLKQSIRPFLDLLRCRHEYPIGPMPTGLLVDCGQEGVRAENFQNLLTAFSESSRL